MAMRPHAPLWLLCSLCVLPSLAGADADGGTALRYPYRSPTYTDALQRCHAGDGNACWTAAEAFGWSPDYDRQPLTDAQLRDQAELWERACQLGVQHACVQRARSLAMGRGVTRNLEQARALAENACAANDPDGCLVLIQLIHDPPRVTTLLRRICTMGHHGPRGTIPADWMPGFPRYDARCALRPTASKPAKEAGSRRPLPTR